MFLDLRTVFLPLNMKKSETLLKNFYLKALFDPVLGFCKLFVDSKSVYSS